MSNVQFQPLWGDPPKSRQVNTSQLDLALTAFIELLRTVPGRWAELSSVEEDGGHPPTRATKIKAQFPDAEVQTRGIPGSKTRRRIWVRIKVNVPDVIASNGETQQARRDRAANAI